MSAKDELIALAERVERRPSLFMATMCALSVFFLSDLLFHWLGQWMNLAPWASDYVRNLGAVAALLTWWQIRYEPVSRLTAALRARANMDDQP